MGLSVPTALFRFPSTRGYPGHTFQRSLRHFQVRDPGRTSLMGRRPFHLRQVTGTLALLELSMNQFLPYLLLLQIVKILQSSLNW
jgi:hypothetical protein